MFYTPCTYLGCTNEIGMTTMPTGTGHRCYVHTFNTTVRITRKHTPTVLKLNDCAIVPVWHATVCTREGRCACDPQLVVKYGYSDRVYSTIKRLAFV